MEQMLDERLAQETRAFFDELQTTQGKQPSPWPASVDAIAQQELTEPVALLGEAVRDGDNKTASIIFIGLMILTMRLGWRLGRLAEAAADATE